MIPDALNVTLSAGVAALAILIIVAALYNILSRWQHIPKTEGFWLLIGMVCHWIATLCNNSLVVVNHFDLVYNYTNINSFGKILVLVAGSFYGRALTMSWTRRAWIYMVAAAGLVGLAMYTFLVAYE